MIEPAKEIIKGVNIYHPDISCDIDDFNSDLIDTYKELEETSFWYLARRDFIYKQIKKYISENDNTIEVGSSTGSVSRFLMDKGYKRISLGDMHTKGLIMAKEAGFVNCYQFDLLRSPFNNEFDNMLLFDVLEHIEDDMLALKKACNSIVKNGYVVITVPAFMKLWNRFDKISGHKRRYTKKQLNNIVQKSGFSVIESRYFFRILTPAIWVRKFIHPDDGSPVSEDEYAQSIKFNKFINKVLYYISILDNKLNKFIPNWFGGSLMVIAKKK